MRQGRILLYRNCPDVRGKPKDKFFIVLNTPQAGEKFLLAITTSSWRFKSDRFGCFLEYGCYLLRANEDYFPRDTSIELHDARTYSQAQILKYLMNKTIEKKKILKEKILKEIITCFKLCIDVSQELKDMVN